MLIHLGFTLIVSFFFAPEASGCTTARVSVTLSSFPANASCRRLQSCSAATSSSLQPSDLDSEAAVTPDSLSRRGSQRSSSKLTISALPAQAAQCNAVPPLTPVDNTFGSQPACSSCCTWSALLDSTERWRAVRLCMSRMSRTAELLARAMAAATCAGRCRTATCSGDDPVASQASPSEGTKDSASSHMSESGTKSSRQSRARRERP